MIMFVTRLRVSVSKEEKGVDKGWIWEEKGTQVVAPGLLTLAHSQALGFGPALSC